MCTTRNSGEHSCVGDSVEEYDVVTSWSVGTNNRAVCEANS